MNESKREMRELCENEIRLVGGGAATIKAIGSGSGYTQYMASCPSGQVISTNFDYETETSNSVWDDVDNYNCTPGDGYTGIIWDQEFDGSLFYGFQGGTGM